MGVCVADAGWGTLASASVTPAVPGAKTCVSLLSEFLVSVPVMCALWEIHSHLSSLS